jgi:nicotinamide mononucleotide transporter
MTAWLAGHWAEILGFGTGAACVVLAARRRVATFPVGIVNNLVFVVLFTGSALYADAGLQIVYLALGVHGWLAWSRREPRQRFVRSTPPSAVLPLAAAGLAGTALLTWVLAAYTDSTTELADAATTAGSLVAQYLLNRRWWETWLVWIAVDVAYVGLYAVKGLWITAALYLLFIGLCVAGLRSWRTEREPARA